MYFKPFSAIEIKGLTIKDQNGQSIVHVNELSTDLKLSQLLNHKVTIDELRLDQAFVNFEIFKDSSNFSNLKTYFFPQKDQKTSSKKQIEFKLGKVILTESNLKLRNHNFKAHNKGVNFADLEVTNIAAVFDEIKTGNSLSATISDLTLQEKSGLIIHNLSTQATFDAHQMEFKKLYLKTNRSVVQDYVKLEYQSLADFSNFINKVSISSELKNANIDSRDIAYFAPTMHNVVFQTAIHRATLGGTVANINAKNIHLSTATNTSFKGDIAITGLPNINRTIFKANILQLQTSANDVEHLVPKLANRSNFLLPKQIRLFAEVNYVGSFNGYYNDFIVKGEFNTALGNISTQSHLVIKDRLSYQGLLNTQSLNLGKLIASSEIGTSAVALNYKGSGINLADLNLHFSGSFHDSQLMNYSYQNINVEGTLQDSILDLAGNIYDKYLKVDYKTTIDWQGNTPSYLLDAKVTDASLNKLGFLHQDSVTIHNAEIRSNLSGNSLNTLTGTVDADSIQLATSKGDFNVGSLRFSAEGSPSNKILSLNSEVLDAKMEGDIDLNTIVPYFKSLAMRYAPAIGIETEPYNRQNFNLTVDIKMFKPIAPLLNPALAMEKGARLNALFESDKYRARFKAFTPQLSYKGLTLRNLTIQENADEKAFSLDVLADRLNLTDSMYINNIAIRNTLANDSLLFNVKMSEPHATNHLDLYGNIHFAHNGPAYILFKPSTIRINQESWKLNNDAEMRVSKGKFYITNLIVSHLEQRVKMDGILSDANERLNVHFDRFSLSSLNGITAPLGIELKGLLNGHIELNSLFKKPFLTGAIHTSPIVYNGLPVGQLNLKGDFDPNIGTANINLSLHDEQQRGIKLDGNYNFYDDDEPLMLSGKLHEADLALFQPFLKNLVSNLQGKGSADINIKGTFKNPKITGTGRVNDASFTVNYLKTDYHIDNQLAMVENNAILLQNLQIRDSKNQVATTNGIINLAKLATPYIDVDVSGTNFMILNTTLKDNNLYYGTAHATGVFRFKGYTTAIDIDIKAKSEKGTTLTIPFNSAMTVSEESDFIYFISKDASENEKMHRKSLFKGITMKMDLNLTPDAEINLHTHLGSLKGNGYGAIGMKITSLGDFEMFGDYSVNSGKFHFTAQDFINKYFDIKEGGTIRWSGKPDEAVINLTAIYQQRTAVGPLYNAAGRPGDDERVLAQADMLIKGTLDQPDITFGLNFPQNPYIKDQLQSYLSDLNNVNQQALSLIVRRSFTPNSTSELGREVNSTLLSAGAEIAFNQLNNIISESLNINFFDLNIRSFNDASASVRLLNDRLVLTGGITDRTNYQASDLTFFREGITTDAELTYRLRKDGNLILRAYNRPYTRNFLFRMNDDEYISAFGIVYRQEFDTFSEFWRKMWNWGYRKEEKPKENKK